jgi:hypothetical protein
MSQSPPARVPAAPAEPVNVVDGIPDRSTNPRPWKTMAVGGIFLVWLGFLIYCLLAG